MNKFLNEKEKEEFLEYLKKHNLHDNAELAKRFYVSKSTVSVNLPKFQRKKERKSNGKVPRIWKDVIELSRENKELKEKLDNISKIV